MLLSWFQLPLNLILVLLRHAGQTVNVEKSMVKLCVRALLVILVPLHRAGQSVQSTQIVN